MITINICDDIHIAAVCGHEGIIDVLLANKADKTTTDNSGDTPFDACDLQLLKQKLSYN